MTRRARLLVVLWLIVGGIVWLGVHDYVQTRGHKEYLYRSAEARLGIEPPPGKSADLREVLAVEGRHAWVQATDWALFLVACGWGTVAIMRR